MGSQESTVSVQRQAPPSATTSSSTTAATGPAGELGQIRQPLATQHVDARRELVMDGILITAKEMSRFLYSHDKLEVTEMFVFLII